MRAGASWAALAMVATALSGCISTTDELDPAATDLPAPLDEVLQHIPLVLDHDHADASLHAGSHRMSEVAYSALQDDETAWLFGEADVVGETAVVATLAPKGGFVVVDIADRTAPAIIGRYMASTTYAADVKLTADGKWAVVGSQLTANDAEWMPPQHLPPVDGSSVGINGFQLVSLADPAAPRFVSFLPVEPIGVHMLDLHVIGGATYAFGAPGFAGQVTIARLVDTPLGGALVPVGKYVFPSEQGAAIPGGPHDVTVYDDEELGIPVMLVAAGTEGVHMVDVSVPTAPRLLGKWTENEGLYVHTVMPAIVEGKRLVVAVPETYSADEQQPLWVLDAADPGAITTLAVWRLPGPTLPYDGDYLFSTHNFNVLDGRIYLAHVHAGVWVLDISTLEKAAVPEVVGAFVPSRGDAVGDGRLLGVASVPSVWDVVPLGDGDVLVADIPTGLYIVRESGAATP